MRRSPPTLLLASLLASLIASLIGCEADVPDAPPSIKYGQDLCAHCNMIITDARHAAASLVRVDGRRRALAFDDVGDLIDYHRERADAPVERQFVADSGSGAWVEFGRAHFVRAPDVHTPMGSGILAFASESDARAAADKHGGAVATPDQIVALHANAGVASTSACRDADESR
jgi:copper chaperone NosL